LTDGICDEIQFTGDRAITRFSFTHTVTPINGGEADIHRNRGLWVIHQQPNDAWRIHWEMVNSIEAMNER
jgi:hypothetical protein